MSASRESSRGWNDRWIGVFFLTTILLEFILCSLVTAAWVSTSMRQEAQAERLREQSQRLNEYYAWVVTTRERLAKQGCDVPPAPKGDLP